MHRDGLDVALAFVQRVDELDVAVAAQAEGVRHLLADQVVDDDLAAVEPVVGEAFQHFSDFSRTSLSSSCPRLSRASTSFFLALSKTWMAGTSPAMTGRGQWTNFKARS